MRLRRIYLSTVFIISASMYKAQPLFVVLLAVSSSRCAFVQSGPRLSTNTPTFFSNYSRCTKRVPRFLSFSPCKPCETTVWQQILCLLLLVAGHAFRILSIPTGSREEYVASTQSRTKPLLEHDLKKENEYTARNSPQMSAPTAARPAGKRNICPREPKNSSK